MKLLSNRHRICLLAVMLVIASVAFTAGYRLGIARQESRLLNEFLINATNLGILDYERLRELTVDAESNDGAMQSNANGRGN